MFNLQKIIQFDLIKYMLLHTFTEWPNLVKTLFRSQFCKEPLPDRSFTFWDWFHAVMKLTKEDLRSLWIDG